jgi:hypothetical protein
LLLAHIAVCPNCRRERVKVARRFLEKCKERHMSPATVAAAAVFISALTKSRWRNGAAMRRDSFEVLTDNVKAAANEVDTSAARVELALKPLMAA